MPIIYPIVTSTGGGGGGSGDATSIRGTTISTNTPQNFQVLTYQNFGTPEWRASSVPKVYTIFSNPTYFTGTSGTEITKFKIGDLADQTEQYYSSFFAINADISNGQTGSITISGSLDGIVLDNFFITSSQDFFSYNNFSLTASSIYTVFASSSNTNSQFKIYNLLIRYQ